EGRPEPHCPCREAQPKPPSRVSLSACFLGAARRTVRHSATLPPDPQPVLQSIFGATSESKPWATARCTELDDGKLHDIIHALRTHSTSCAEASKCPLCIFHNHAR